MGGRGEMWSIFYLILFEKNFLGLGALACLLDLSAVSMLWQWMWGAFVDFGVSANRSSFGDFVGN